jgi:hypothetical protein
MDLKLIDAVKSDFNRWRKDRLNSVTTLAFVTENGALKVHENTACHAGLRSPGYCIQRTEKILGILSGVQKSRDYKPKEEDSLLFFDFMANKSPWSDCFISKNPEKILADDYWVLNPEAPCNLMTSAAFATRHISEWPYNFKAWLNFVKAGVDPTKAFFFSYYFDGEGAGKVATNTGRGGWHQPFPTNRSKTYYKNFLSHTPANPGEPYQKARSYGSIDSVWGSNNTYVKVTDIETIKPIKPNEFAIVNRNIFYKPKPVRGMNHIFSGKDQLTHLANELDKLYG